MGMSETVQKKMNTVRMKRAKDRTLGNTYIAGWSEETKKWSES